MGRAEAYDALVALGGSGTFSQIKEQLLKDHPDEHLHEYFHLSLKRLVNEHTISRERKGKEFLFTILTPYERNVTKIKLGKK